MMPCHHRALASRTIITHAATHDSIILSAGLSLFSLMKRACALGLCVDIWWAIIASQHIEDAVDELYAQHIA